MFKLISKMFGNNNDRQVRRMLPLVNRINDLEPQMEKLRDEEFPIKVADYKQRVANGESLDALLPEMFALVREASIRTTGMRHFNVQMIGGIVLHQGKIAEMKTGEGKTLVATLPLSLNALTGKGAQLVTVNDYLASRDAEWMSKIYNFLGYEVGIITNDLNDRQRKENYAADITYGTNNEFGFDYLRDNMKFALDDYVQRDLHYAIIDEVDSILIDEARTPLIISGPSSDATDLYFEVDKIIPKLQKGLHFTIDEKSRTVVLSDEGVERVQSLLKVDNLYDPTNILILHHTNQALRAHAVYKRDVDYMVKNNEVMIIDEFTGRALPGRRWSDGLHQAVEAKEKVKVEGENETLATISFQNYFRLYDKLAGMTGTALTESAEFHKTYKLDVVAIPTNKPIQRIDHDDEIYRTEKEKFHAVIEEIKEAHERGQPVLVGTISIERSEVLHKMLKRLKIPHNVLNARHHSREAEIVSQAGRAGAVTIATNMAGRGTDIVLGGNPEPFVEEILESYGVNAKSIESTIFIKEALKGDEAEARKLGRKLAKISDADLKKIFEKRDEWQAEAEKVLEAGGFRIIGTERHDSRRIDNQLRGRSGRQGDPGNSRFYLSLEDDLMRRFSSEKLGGLMQNLGMEEGEPITHRFVSKAIENAQQKVEQHNFEIRKNMLEYDDVMDIQRKTIYRLRREFLANEEMREKIMDDIESVIVEMAEKFCHVAERAPLEGWDFNGLNQNLFKVFHLRDVVDKDALYSSTEPFDTLLDQIWNAVETEYKRREEEFGHSVMREVERDLFLIELDEQWKLHLKGIDELREGVNLQGYRQIDPKLVYKKEAYDMFQSLLALIKRNVTEKLFHIQGVTDDTDLLEDRRQQPQEMMMHHGSEAEFDENGEPIFDETKKPETVRREGKKLGRNDPCWCGSGKKYKNCHYRADKKAGKI